MQFKPATLARRTSGILSGADVPPSQFGMTVYVDPDVGSLENDFRIRSAAAFSEPFGERRLLVLRSRSVTDRKGSKLPDRSHSPNPC